MKALLLIDLQNGLCKPEGNPTPLSSAVADEDVLNTARACLDTARSQRLEMIHIRLAFDPAYQTQCHVA